MQIEDAAIDLDVLEIMATFGTEQVFLDVLLESCFVAWKLCSPTTGQIRANYFAVDAKGSHANDSTLGQIHWKPLASFTLIGAIEPELEVLVPVDDGGGLDVWI